MHRVAALLVLALLGSAYSARLPYIVNGQDAEIGEFPWQGSLQQLMAHKCGASLISDEWALTASHCMFGPTWKWTYTLVLGAHDKTFQLKGDPTRHIISQIIIHPHYKNGGSPTQPGDIALLKLKTKADLTSKYIKPIKLASASDDFTDQTCMISGWGSTKSTITIITPNTLQKTDVKVVYQRKNHIGVLKRGSSACVGDSGGPLACQRNGTWYLMGAASYVSVERNRDCSTSMPSVYTSVPYYREWIKENSGL